MSTESVSIDAQGQVVRLSSLRRVNGLIDNKTHGVRPLVLYHWYYGRSSMKWIMFSPAI
jgi:hypothetical protein